MSVLMPHDDAKFNRTAALANWLIGEFRKRMDVIIEPALCPKTVTYLIVLNFSDKSESCYTGTLSLSPPKMPMFS